mgnify:CR=1 FL=1
MPSIKSYFHKSETVSVYDDWNRADKQSKKVYDRVTIAKHMKIARKGQNIVQKSATEEDAVA